MCALTGGAAVRTPALAFIPNDIGTSLLLLLQAKRSPLSIEILDPRIVGNPLAASFECLGILPGHNYDHSDYRQRLGQQ